LKKIIKKSCGKTLQQFHIVLKKKNSQSAQYKKKSTEIIFENKTQKTGTKKPC
jgi:hypothetical protein